MPTQEFTPREFIARLSKWSQALENHDWSQALQQCTDPVATMFTEIFASGMDSEGKPWPQHAASTVARYGPHPLLVLTGEMYESLTGGSSVAHVENITDTEFEWGTSVVYGPTHQFGDASRNIPQREFVYWTQSGQDDVEAVLDEYLNELIETF